MAAEESLEGRINGNRYQDLSPEELAAEIEKTRLSLAGKLNRLEEEVGDKVRSTVDHVSGQIVGTVDHITDTVKTSVAKVQSQFDIPARIQENPYKTLGGILVAGVAFGAWLGQKKRGSHAGGPSLLHGAAPNGVGPLVKGLIGTVVVSAGRQLIETKVHGLIQNLQRSGRI